MYVGTYNQPLWKRDAVAEYNQCHIKGALLFDIREVADKSSQFPVMLPSPEQFADQVGKVRINMTVDSTSQ